MCKLCATAMCRAMCVLCAVVWWPRAHFGVYASPLPPTLALVLLALPASLLDASQIQGVAQIRAVFCEVVFRSRGSVGKEPPQIRAIPSAAYTVTLEATFKACVKSVVFSIGEFTNCSVYRSICLAADQTLSCEVFPLWLGSAKCSVYQQMCHMAHLDVCGIATSGTSRL